MKKALVLFLVATVISLTGCKSEAEKKSEDLKSLTTISMALQLFAGEHGKRGDFPEKLSELRAQKLVVDPNVFRSSFSKSKAKITDENIDSQTDYVYVGKSLMDTSMPATMIPICFTKPGLIRGGVYVIFVDTHVDWVAGDFKTPSDVVEHFIKVGEFDKDVSKILRDNAK